MSRIRTFLKGLDDSHQLQFVLTAAKYLYLVSNTKEGGVKFQTADEKIGRYLNERIERSNRQTMTVEAAIKAIETKWKTSTPEEKAKLVEVRIAALETAKVPLADIQAVLAPAPAPAASASAWNFSSWDPFANVSPPAPKSTRLPPVAPPPVAPTPARPLPTRPFSATTLTALDTYIASIYPDDQRTGAKLSAGHQSIARVIGPCENAFIRGWRPIYSSGTNNDCLIHSFLTATCPSFRALSQDHKNAFADSFRRKHLPSLAAYQALPSREQDELAGRGFLSNAHAAFLTDVYKVDLLSLEGEATGNRGATLIGDTHSERVYIILNPDNAHYESVQPRPGNSANFSISRREAEQALACISPEKGRVATALRGVAAAACMEPGTSVSYQGREYMILEGRVKLDETTGEVSCGGYLLSTAVQFADYLALPPFLEVAGKRVSKEETTVKIRYVIPACRMGNSAIYLPVRDVLPPSYRRNTANVTRNTRNNYIRKRLEDPTNGAELLAAGVPERNLRQAFGEAWNLAAAERFAAAEGGSRTRRRKRSLRPKRRHTSKGHGRSRYSYKH